LQPCGGLVNRRNRHVHSGRPALGCQPARRIPSCPTSSGIRHSCPRSFIVFHLHAVSSSSLASATSAHALLVDINSYPHVHEFENTGRKIERPRLVTGYGRFQGPAALRDHRIFRTSRSAFPAVAAPFTLRECSPGFQRPGFVIVPRLVAVKTAPRPPRAVCPPAGS